MFFSPWHNSDQKQSKDTLTITLRSTGKAAVSEMLSGPGRRPVLRVGGLHVSPRVCFLSLGTPWVSRVPLHNHSSPNSHKNGLIFHRAHRAGDCAKNQAKHYSKKRINAKKIQVSKTFFCMSEGFQFFALKKIQDILSVDRQ